MVTKIYSTFVSKGCFAFKKIGCKINFALANCYFITSSFDLWMLKGAYDIFPLVIKFLGVN